MTATRVIKPCYGIIFVGRAAHTVWVFPKKAITCRYYQTLKKKKKKKLPAKRGLIK